MTAPATYLEQTRGRILAEAEPVRVASRVLIVSGGERLGRRVRGSAYLGLTDRRIVLVSNRLRSARAELLSEWPASAVGISVSSRKLGGNVIHLVLDRADDPRSGEQAGRPARLSFEWLGGHRPRDWANHRFRR